MDLQVELFEAVAEPQPIGAGLLLQPTGQAVLKSMGLLDTALAHGARIDRLYGDSAHGRTVLDMAYQRFAPEAHGLGLQRGALMGLLWERLRATEVMWRCGVMVDRFEQDDEGVSLYADGVELGRYDALILANGSFSNLRSHLRLTHSARTFPWGALWTVLPAHEDFRQPVLRQRFRAAREMVGFMPVGRNFGEGEQGVNLFWSLPSERVQAWTNATPESLAALKRAMVTLLPEIAPLLEALQSPQQLRQARYADVLMASCHEGRVLAIGDCAHGMSPQLGQGANMALIDAHVLALRCESASDWPERFAAFSACRLGHHRFYTQASRLLTPMFQSHQRLGPWLRDTFMGPGRYLPLIDQQSLATLAGYKTGWLSGRLTL